MAAGLARATSAENVSTSLSAGITDVATSMTVADASLIQSPCYLVIDRVDSAGTLKSTSLWEYVKVTAKVGNDLTITRAQGGSTGQSHSSGAVVEAVTTAAMWEEYYAALNPEHTATGTHVMGTATVNYVEAKQGVFTSVVSIAQLYTPTLTATNIIGGKGQFVWTSVGALATTIASTAGDSHLSFLRASKNLTLNSVWAGVNSAPSLSFVEIGIQYRSTPTAALANLLTNNVFIDVGEYTTDSAATVASLALTSLASGSLLYPSIQKPGSAGDLTLSIVATER